MSPKESVTNNRVVELIKDEVEKMGVRGLSRAVGISPAIITRYTQGKVGEPSQATLEKLAAYFCVPVLWLRGGANIIDSWMLPESSRKVVVKEWAEGQKRIAEEYAHIIKLFEAVPDNERGELIMVMMSSQFTKKATQ